VESHTGTASPFQLALIQRIPTHKNKWGILKNGQWVLQPIYDSIDTRFEVWKLSKEGKSTWCDTAGQLLAPFRFSNMGYLDGHFFDVRQGGKWGIYDARKDSVIIPVQYEDFDYCGGCGMASDYVLAKKNGKWGVVGFNNKTLVPFEYEHEHFRMRGDEWVMSFRRKGTFVLINMRTHKVFSSPEYQFPDEVLWGNLACLKKNRQYGLVTAEGKPVTKFEYDYITWFDDMKERRNDYACVEQHGRYGLIDTSGRIVVPIEYSGLIWAYDDSSFYMNGEDKKTLLGRDGKPLLPDYYKEISEMTVEGQQPYLFSVSQNDKYGLYNRRSNQLTPLIYDDLSAYDLPGFIVTTRDKQKGLLDLQGREVLSPQFDEIESFHSYSDIIQVRKGDHEGLYDTSGKVIFPPVYDFIFRDYADTHFLSLKVYTPEGGGLVGLGTTSGQVLVPSVYSSILELDGHFWVLQKDSTYFLFDGRTGQKDSLPYKAVSVAGEQALLLVSDGKTVKLFDPASRHVIADGYETIYGFKDHRAIAQKDGKMGAIDAQGHIVIPFIYTQLADCKGGLAVAEQDNKYGFIDSTGRLVITIDYDKPSGYSSTADYMLGEHVLLFKQDSATGELLKGLASMNGQVIAPSIYDLIWKDEQGQGFLVRRNAKFGVLAADGEGGIPAIYDDMQPTEANRFTNATSLSFPLLCYDGQSWRYVTAAGKVLPLTIKTATRTWEEDTPDYPIPRKAPVRKAKKVKTVK
jgi:hypothetical protein